MAILVHNNIKIENKIFMERIFPKYLFKFAFWRDTSLIRRVPKPISEKIRNSPQKEKAKEYNPNASVPNFLAT